MTLGGKIRQARVQCGLSQTQLAEMLCVSRSAIAKWETDKGLPDIGNLKVLSRLLNVTVDDLLDDGDPDQPLSIRESFSTANYGKGCKKMIKDQAIRDKFPNSKIFTLFARKDLTEAAIVPQPLPGKGINNSSLLKDPDMEFYLVEQSDKQFLVCVTDGFMDLHLLEQPIKDGHFSLNGWNFIKSNYELA